MEKHFFCGRKKKHFYWIHFNLSINIRGPLVNVHKEIKFDTFQFKVKSNKGRTIQENPAPLVSHLGLLRIEFAYSIKLISMVWLCFCSNSSRSINGLSTRNRHQQTFGNCLLYSPNYFLHFSYCFRNEWSVILVLLPE